MSMRTLPLVFVNLGGEMLYILDQRLRAHNTSEDNSEKAVWSEDDRKRVMNDIIRTMFSRDFMEELLKPQQLYSHKTLKTVLTRLAHASIMRLNPASMDRLYELMIMAFKYQLFLCPRPRDLLLITYNHIDTIREFIKDTPTALNQVDETHRKVIEVYTPLSEAEFQLIRQTLLIFFQDMHIRVSIFLKDKVQNPNGRFALSTLGSVPHGIDVPGLTRMFDNQRREVKRCTFPTGGSYSSPIREGSFELHGDRVITLGTNMYNVTHPQETHTPKTPSIKTDDTPNLLAKEELNLLARLMGGVEIQGMPCVETGFRINLLPTDTEEEEAGAAGGHVESLFGVINIQAKQDVQATNELARIAGEFADKGEKQGEPSSISKGDDLLAMMDEL
ncbi:protein OSCP1a [Lampris incognitus]|uniref:protein OSCP1a n=1 Tax=Lampris incognitus TaxID=2546036 RepID=UPI0024B5E7A6|nr:protein OSCP1a [Lampris incognitus]